LLIPLSIFFFDIIYHPIITVGSPTAAVAPQAQVSPTRTAGMPPINTVPLPTTKGVTGGWGTGITQTCESPRIEAGMPPIKTVATPGPTIVPP
jgi:hypothetical protein